MSVDDTVFSVLWDKRDDDGLAVVQGQRRVTYGELCQLCVNSAHAIDRTPSSVVVLMMPSSPDYVAALFATLGLGRTIYPVSADSTAAELRSALERTGASAVVTTRRLSDEYVSSLPSGTQVLVPDDRTKGQEAQPQLFARASQGRVYLNTSGSTSKHKIVELSQRGLLINAADWIEIALDPARHGRVLVTLPAATSFTTVVFVTCARLGWTIHLPTGMFLLQEVVSTIHRERITHMISIGSMLNLISSEMSRLQDPKLDLTSLEFVGIGGNGARADTMRSLMRLFPNAGMSPGYGLTEATCMVATIPPRVSRESPELFEEKIGAAGLAFPSQVIRILVDGEYTTLRNVVGEICLGGPSLMVGYLDQPEVTAETIRDGWLHTGDLGYLDKDGFLYIAGRRKNIIKSGGYTIYPEEIEQVLSAHPRVKECIVRGVPDEEMDEKVVADVRAEDADVDTRELRLWCRERLTPYKVPSEFNFVAELMKTKTEKVKRNV